MKFDANKVMGQCEQYRDEMVQFMRDLIAIPSESCQEKGVIERIKQEMEKVGFDEIKIDASYNFV